MEKEEVQKIIKFAEILPDNERSAKIIEKRNQIEQQKQEKLNQVSRHCSIGNKRCIENIGAPKLDL